MTGEGVNGEMLSHILSKLETIEKSISNLQVELASIKGEAKATDSVAETMKEHGQRIMALELKAAAWGGTASAGAGVGRWVATILGGVIVAALCGGAGWLLHR